MSNNSYVIVVGNEKGGSGKSTLSIHLAIAYLYAGYKVATIDLVKEHLLITLKIAFAMQMTIT